jgi:hypothetical protein
MAKILDPDLLTFIVNGSPASENLRVNTSTKTIRIVAGGSLVALDGVTLQCIYSKLKELWKADATLPKHKFPIDPIHDESMELVNGWDWYDDATRKLIRDGGWAVRNVAGAITQMWACVVTLGQVISGAPYYTQDSSTSASTATFTYCATGGTFGINEAIQIYSDPNGDGNTADGYDRRNYLKVFLREQGKTYDEASNTDVGYPTLSYKKFNFPVTHSVDAKIAASDGTIDGSAPYTGMSATWYAAAQAASLGANGPYNFHVIINANGGTAQQEYEWIQRQLRKTSDIDAGAGTRTGKVAAALAFFNGSLLTTILQSVGGVHIASPSSASLNDITEADDTGALRIYPFTASLTIEFDSFLVADAGPAKYWVYFTNDDAGSNTGRDYGTDTAILAKNASAVDMTGNVSGASISLTFDYDGNVQRGAGSAGTDAPVTVVAMGLATAKWGIGTATIGRNTANKAVVQPGLDRNYVNP